MAEGIHIEIVAPDRLVMSGDVRSATVPAQEGYFTVMGDHAPVLALLRPGFVTVVEDGSESQVFFVRGGSAEVSPEGLTILAEQARAIADFDRAGVEEELRQAEEELARATTIEGQSAAQALVDALRNFIDEATHMTPPVSL